jgi:ribosome biogenesis GTPase A
MSLQWYPGHMTKARRELAALMSKTDVVIEVVDARLPAASTNPMVAELRGERPCVRVLAKSDLADPDVTAAWLAHLNASAGVVAFASTTERPGDTRKRIVQLCASLVPRRGGPDRPVRAVIAGVPNSGKSTLINTLMGREVAVVSDRPAVTKQQQRVVLPGGVVVTDTPGIMWPKIEDEDGAYRLALAGSIPATAFDFVNLGRFGAALLLARYPAQVVARYKLAAAPASADALLEEIGRRRGGLRTGGLIDLHKASEVLVHDLRAGAIGRISLETPPVAD